MSSTPTTAGAPTDNNNKGTSSSSTGGRMSVMLPASGGAGSVATAASFASGGAATPASAVSTTSMMISSTTTPSSSTTAVASSSSTTTPLHITDAAVLDYLQRKGLGTAVMELQQRLEQEQQQSSSKSAAKAEKTTREQLDEDETINRNQRSLLTKSTGGSYGYDRDAAWPILQWGVPDTTIPTDGSSTNNNKTTMGADEARAYLDAFVSVQLWVLSLPDDDDGNTTYDDNTNEYSMNVSAGGASRSILNPIQRAHALMKQQQQAGGSGTTTTELSLKSVMTELAKPTIYYSSNNSTNNNNNPTVSASADTTTSASGGATTTSTAICYNFPPSAKKELLAVSFALLVHTYCELLEVGMESTAHIVRDAFQPIYSPIYEGEYRDLYHCTTTEDMMRLNSHNSQHMEALANLKTILVQVASYQFRRQEYMAQTTVNGEAGKLNPQQQQAIDTKIAEYDRYIDQFKNKYNELANKATLAFGKMHDLPFLRRARAVRWQLSLSTTSYGLLSSYLNTQQNNALLPMSSLLQTKCELHVERRNPLPFTPTCILDDTIDLKERINMNNMEINWAAPIPRWREEASTMKLPFPKFNLDEEYETEDDAKYDKRLVEFNRALLVNGFRRLEALERKREYDVLPRATQKRIKENGSDAAAAFTIRRAADPFKPSILMTTLCSSNNNNTGLTQNSLAAGSTRSKASSSSHRGAHIASDVASIWEEPGIGLVCAQLCAPDGRRIAVGCDDSAVRIWSSQQQQAGATNGEPLQVLLGHKNGFPVFDVDWNRDGRTLLSAGGDGSVRLWDTMLVGPFGEVATSSNNKKDPSTPSKHGADEMIPGWRPESDQPVNGAALAVYRGHAPLAPVWSVAFAPSGYYFASAGADATARLWTTDRPVPVRLFTGHTSWNVNCVEWHPNCNYILTGSDDKTARLWDIQSGRTVRLLTGFASAVNAVQIDPSGQHAAVAEYNGVVHLWDLGTGKKITEFRHKRGNDHHHHYRHSQQSKVPVAAIHALKFSACGTALATGGDDCSVRIWDVRRDTVVGTPQFTAPIHAFPTRQTMIMDLFYTKRNLLLAAGKYMSPAPVVSSLD